MQANATIPHVSAAALRAVATTPPPASPPVPGGRSRWWLLPWLGLFAWHAWLTLTLFGGEQPWLNMLDDRPLTGGRHPLHLYHGSLGARSFLHDGELCCYDPAFQAGYPKTPVYDGGSRPAELFLVLTAGRRPQAAYKVGLAACCLLLPLSVSVCARGLGFGRRAVFLATLLGLGVWWGGACQRLLASGDLDVLLSGLMLLAQMGLLVRFDRRPGVLIWLGIAATGFLAWFAQPGCAVLLVPPFLVYYLRVGARHEFLWHFALLGGLAVAFGCNVFWLDDWVRYWWLRVPPATGEWLLPHRTPRAVWDSPLWGGPVDRGLGALLLVLAVAGGILCRRRGERATVCLLGLGMLTLFGLALGGTVFDVLSRLEAPALLVPALLLALPLAGHALDEAWQALARKVGAVAVWLALLPLLPLGYLLASPQDISSVQAARPLDQGLNRDQQGVVEALQAHTSADGRILWEDTAEAGTWTALLPGLTELKGRSYIGGIDPENRIEPSACQLRDGILLGRPVAEWGDDELEQYCRRYNVGWVAAWTPGTKERLGRWRPASAACALPGERPGVLYRIERPLTFVLKGKARAFKADVGTVTLCDVVPEDGEVVLSLHYQAKVVASPSRVRVERELDCQDPIPLIRLRVDGPVARITLTFAN